MVEPITINIRFLAQDIHLPQEQVQAVVDLLDAGFPVPFIARYRKDATQNLDEEKLRLIEEELKSARTLCERKQTILKTIDSLGKLTPELDQKIRDAKSVKRLEDLYLPYKPKRQTLASSARERGLEPLALEILDGSLSPEKLDERAAEFIDEDKKVKSVADALLGTGHIIAEIFAERSEVIQVARELVHQTGTLITSKIEPKTPPVKKDEKKSEEPKEQTETAKSNEAEPTPIAEPVGAEVEEPQVEEPVTEPAVAETQVETQTETETESFGELASDAEEVTELFNQVKEAQAEKGMPVVKSQNSIKKQQKAEAKKKLGEIKQRQQEHFEKQFADYFKFSTKLRGIPPHRILAFNRGERGKVLKVKIDVNETQILDSVAPVCVPKEHVHAEFLTGCLKDSLHRLVLPSLEREIRADMTDYAERQAVKVFGKNLRGLLLQPPLFRKRVLTLDPGIKHGCKVVPLDEFGNVLGFETIYLTGSSERKSKAAIKIADIVRKYNISVIAIGNGTASRETEEVISDMIAKFFAEEDLAYVIVNEAGASVYSASPIAKEEFPNYDPLLRGAVSIGRRLQDPLNELVKIEPASLGVGMYQHDIKGKHLKQMLNDIVESCVNYVGVDLNTATPAILAYVAGLNPMTARRIHDYRREHGPFRTREDLKKVSGFGEVAFTHSAGFLKVQGGSSPLDTTRIHPESYELAAKILEKLEFSVNDLHNGEKVKELAAKIAAAKIGELTSQLAAELGAGQFTVRDILGDLMKPGRDPRESLPPPHFRKGVLRLEDLTPDMELTGTVLNVVDFGAFVDIGLHETGLVHVSQMSVGYLRDAHEKVAVGDTIRLWVASIDQERKRFSLTMLPPGTEKQKPDRNRQRDQREVESAPAVPRPEGQRGERAERPPQRDQDNRHTPKPQSSSQSSPQTPPGDRPPRRDFKRRDDRREPDRNRTPKTFVAAPSKAKEVKPITDKMKQGKEPLRSFGDLAQLLGHVQADEPENKKRK